MKIAIISTIRDVWGGSEELWAAFANKAINEGHEIIISKYDCGSLSDKIEKLVKKGATVDLRIGSIQKNLPTWKYIAKRFKRAYDKTAGNPFSTMYNYKPDIVLYVGTAYSIANDWKLLKKLPASDLSFFINVQLNYEQNQVALSSREKEIVAKAYNRAKKIFFVSERNKQVAEKHLDQPINNGILIRNPVNLEDKTTIPFSSIETVQMAMVGNLVMIHKGQDIVLNILKEESWKQRNWRLNIYGAGKDEAYLKELCNINNIAGRVTFHGRVNDIRMVWQKNHLLLMPSHMEGMPLAIVEAMLCGRPGVVTDVGGIAEWIQENKSGFIAAEVSEHAFGLAMKKAWEHKAEWPAMGLQAHERAVQLYDPDPGKTLLDLITA